MTFAELQRESVKRGFYLGDYPQGYILIDLSSNTVAIGPEYCTLEAVKSYLADYEPGPMTDEQADTAMGKILERMQEATGAIVPGGCCR